jgi:adenine-specific DNA-methyltransferase
MPTLDWIGKEAVINHHQQVPFRLLHCREDLSVGDPGTGNLLVEGDNLLALKALLPYYAGKVKCIYIDPPYNTGEEAWVYNDNVNSADIRRWLGHVVGREAEDLSRHDKWLCMMHPRIALLREFLAPDGAIFVNLDDTESGHARCMMDEIFGGRNHLATIAWEKRYTRSNNAKLFYSLKDTILVYRKSDALAVLKEPRTEKSDSIYKNPDNDPRGPWTTSSYVNPARKDQRPNLVYDITNPFSSSIVVHPTHAWKYELAQHQQHVADNRLWWGKSGTAKYPRLKNFLSECSDGMVPVDVWGYEETGTTDEGGTEVKALFGAAVFDNPKPTRLIERIVKLVGGLDSIIMDSFAGSGTTAHSVLRLNKEDGGRRRFILVEMEPDICCNITGQRLKYAIEGYNNGNDHIDGLGGGFRYCTLGEPLFDAQGQIAEKVRFDDLARHVFFTETGEPMPEREKQDSPLIGVTGGVAFYLLFNGILGDKSVDGGNVLTLKLLKSLPPHDGPRIVFGEGCALTEQRLRREGVVFKQIPYEGKVN